jgi:hypothetical protein
MNYQEHDGAIALPLALILGPLSLAAQQSTQVHMVVTAESTNDQNPSGPRPPFRTGKARQRSIAGERLDPLPSLTKRASAVYFD